MSDYYSNLTSDQISEAKEAFSMFDRESEGEIPTDELSTVLRSLGYNCTAATLQQMIKDADPDETGKISEETFLRQVSRAEHESIQSSATPAQLEGLRDGTRFFLGGKSVGEIRRLNESGDDSVPADDLLYVLKAMGERLSDEEAAELAREVRQQQAKSRAADAPQNSTTNNRSVDFKDLLKALGVAPKVGAAAKTAEASSMSRQEEPTTGLGLGGYSSSDSETEYPEPAQSGKRGRSPREKGNEGEAEKLKRVTSSGTSVSMSKQMERQSQVNEDAIKLPSVDELLEGKASGTAAGGPRQEQGKGVALMAPPHVRMKVSNIVTEDQFALGRKR
ncbi:Calcium binding protein [Perkinsus chesapeaki]|uniref:Calmodulin n=1 Tax=Perkinsus chesapeaki TaxID=330153 RepID=A0A7J6MT39_PERCH|nr:Calcium binding protein [Perkinsus chesapeaki]